MNDCIFCRIVAGEIPAKIVHQDNEVTVFHDIDPKAPTHILVIPNRHVASLHGLEEGDAALAGRLLLVARQVAEEQGVGTSGYRVVANVGSDGGQSVDHLHLHVLGGRRLSWPPG